VFRPPATGYVDRVTDPANGPANGPDAPAPPGGPQRGDAADGSRTPGGPADPDTTPEPEAHATGDSREDPSPSPEPTTDGEIHARTQTDQVNEEIQEENAETALDQPSDGSGGE
jgi:hypothetical protein